MGLEGLLVEDAGENGTDGGVERGDGHGKGAGLAQRDDVGDAGDGASDGCGADHDDARLGLERAAEVGELALGRGDDERPDRADAVVERGGDGGEDEHGEEASRGDGGRPPHPCSRVLCGRDEGRVEAIQKTREQSDQDSLLEEVLVELPLLLCCQRVAGDRRGSLSHSPHPSRIDSSHTAPCARGKEPPHQCVRR